jgi:hypothetical protein
MNKIRIFGSTGSDKKPIIYHEIMQGGGLPILGGHHTHLQVYYTPTLYTQEAIAEIIIKSSFYFENDANRYNICSGFEGKCGIHHTATAIEQK